jgi:hypothetical protein
MMMDLPWSPALKAIIFSSLNLLSMTPLTPRSCGNGGTPPGFTPKASTYCSGHIAPFLPTHSSFRSLLQLTLRLARYTSKSTPDTPLTSIVFAPHSRGVLRMLADYYEVLVGEWSIT